MVKTFLLSLAPPCNGVYRTCLLTPSATDTFRMVGCLEHIYVHLTRFCTLLATDTFIIFDFNP